MSDYASMRNDCEIDPLMATTWTIASNNDLLVSDRVLYNLTKKQKAKMKHVNRFPSLNNFIGDYE